MSSIHIGDRSLDGTMADPLGPSIASPLRLITNRCDEDSLLTALEDYGTKQSLTEIRILVSYIMDSGLKTLRAFFAELKRRKITIKVLITHQLGISDFAAVNELARFTNVELRVFEKTTFHSKVWLFLHKERKDRDTVIIGSSNISKSALKTGVESNVAITRGADGVGSPIIESQLKMFDDCFGISTVWPNEDIKQMKQKFDRASDSRIPSNGSRPLRRSTSGASDSVHWGTLIDKPRRHNTMGDETAISLETRFMQAVVAHDFNNIPIILNECNDAALRNRLLKESREWSIGSDMSIFAPPLSYVTERLVNHSSRDEGTAMINLLSTLLDAGADPNGSFVEDDQVSKDRVTVVPLVSLLSSQLWCHVQAWRNPEDDHSKAAIIKGAVRLLLDFKPVRNLNVLDINASEERKTYDGKCTGKQSALGVIVDMWDKIHPRLNETFENFKSPEYQDYHERLKNEILIPVAKELIERGASGDFRPKVGASPLTESTMFHEAWE